MKTYIAILAIIGITYGAHIPVKTVRDLGDDLKDLLDLIPAAKIIAVVENHLIMDSEVQKDFQYLQSDKVVALIDEIDAAPEVKKVFSYISEHGYPDIYDTVNTVHDFLGWHHVQPEKKKLVARIGKLPSHRTLKDMVQEIEDLLPIDDIKALYEDKLKNSADFKGLYDMLSGQEFHDFVDKIYNEPSTQEIIKDLKNLNVDVDEVVKLVKDLLGWVE